LRGFFLGIPKEMDEAAELEGCSKWKIFYKIILPIAKPAIATLIITDFLATWNEYLLASVIINDNKLKTVPIGLMTFVGEHGTDYGYLCAGVLISVIPVIIVYLIFQKNFVEGMSDAVKS
jgi:raffinose/stachyose/melibiose transport system permease protein